MSHVRACFFQTLYKAQLTDLREDFEEKRRQNQDLEEERNELTRQLQMAIVRSDAESLAKSIAHETIAELEKEKTMKELEIKDLMARQKTELSNKDILITSVRNLLAIVCPILQKNLLSVRLTDMFFSTKVP